MIKKNFLLFFIFITHFLSAQGGPPPPGCLVYTVFDDNNDGFAQFDLDTYFAQFRNSALTTGTGYDLSGYQIEFYPSATDYSQGTNQITSSPYTNIVSFEQFCFMKFIYSGIGPFYDEAELSLAYACHKLKTTNALTTISQIKDLIQLYPNPVSSNLNIKYKKETTVSTSIYDLNGRLLIAGNAAASIDVSELQDGIYLVRIVAEGKEFTRKITVAH